MYPRRANCGGCGLGTRLVSGLRDLVSLQKMASQPEQSVTEIESFVRGYHDYKNIWQPTVGEVLVLKREPANDKDSLIVCIEKHGQVVGHVPLNLAPLIS